MNTRLPACVLNSVLIASVSLALAGCSGQSIPGSQILSPYVDGAPLIRPLKALPNNVNAQILWQVDTGENTSNVKIHPFINSTAIYTANGAILSARNKTRGKLLWNNPIGQINSGFITIYATTDDLAD